MKSFIPVIGFSLVSAIILQGCGNDQLGKDIKLGFDATTGQATLDLSMGDGLEVALNGEFPIANGLGSLTFVPATRTDNAKIRIAFDATRAMNEQLGGYGVSTTLPNGAPMPVAMTPPLITIPVLKKGEITVDALLAIVPELQVGANVHIAQFKSKYFPAGIAICQNFRNEERVAFAAVCIFGPSDTRSGGIFIGANLGEILNLNDLIAPPAAVAASSNRALLSSARELNQVQYAMAHVESVEVQSDEWTEERYDPNNQLSGQRGLKAFMNAKKILSKK